MNDSSENLGAHRWLVLDDDVSLLELAATVLRSAPGAEVVTCANPSAALELLRAKPETFELIVTDFNMPGMNGLEFARRARELAPLTKLLLVTGSVLQAIEPQQDKVDALLRKPYRPAALLDSVRLLLGGRVAPASV